MLYLPVSSIESVDGGGTEWSSWTECSVTCGDGIQNRTRQCIGTSCTGPEVESRSCNVNQCPVDGMWGVWSNWTECSLTCGTGEMQRYRICNGPYYGGQDCTGHENETIQCNPQECPIDGVWELWSAWEGCSVTCGGGNQTRRRTCTGPFYGGQECPGNWTETQQCNTFECSVDGVWELWSAWEGCSVTCGGGNQTRRRTCTGPFYGGQECPGNWTETQQCNTFECSELHEQGQPHVPGCI